MTDYWNELPTNYSNGQSVSGFGSLLHYSNEVTGGVFTMVILLLTFGISFLTLKQFSGTKALGASMFVTTIISILLMRMGMLSMPIVVILSLITIVMILLVRKESQAMGL